MRKTKNAALGLVFSAIVAGQFGGHPARAQVQHDAVTLGVLDDMSGPYAENSGPGDLLATKMAAEDFGGTVLGKPIRVIGGDLQNKVDIGVEIARRWYDTGGVDVILGLGNSAVALAVQKLAWDKDRITLATVAATTELTGAACSPNGAQWVYDTYALSKGAVNAVTKQGGNKWFFVTADYAFGHSLEQNAAAFVKAAGGVVVGDARHPVGTSDFSAYLLQAQSSGANVIGIANAGADTTNALKQAAEFGLDKTGQKLVGLLVQDTEIHSVGLASAQGLQFVEAFYWNLNDTTRAFSARFAARHGAPPTMVQAGTYSAAMHYLKAVQAAGTDSAKPVMAMMRQMPINDFMTTDGTLRPDGRVIRDMYLLRAKRPEDSKGEWDLLDLVQTIKGTDAFRPLSESDCPLLKKRPE